MTTYDETKGIYHTNPLRCADLGNVLPPSERRGPVRYCAPGTIGKMNTGLVNWTGDPYTADGKLDRVEIEYTTPNGQTKGLARLFTTHQTRGGVSVTRPVGTRTVEHWFGLADRFGRIENRNCVPIATRDKRICSLAGQGDRGLDARLRCFMACALVVDGGLKRVPFWTRPDPTTGLPYEVRYPNGKLDDAVAMLELIYDGDLDYTLSDSRTPPLSKAWCQLTIEPSTKLRVGWDVVVLYMHQRLGEPSEEMLPDDDDE